MENTRNRDNACNSMATELCKRLVEAGYNTHTCLLGSGGGLYTSVHTRVQQERSEVVKSIMIRAPRNGYSLAELFIVKIRVECDHRTITYRCKNTEIAKFNYEKVLKAHINELNYAIQKRKVDDAAHASRMEMEKMADIEVPLPHSSARRPIFSRIRSTSGSYTVHLKVSGLSLKETCELRGIAYGI